MSFCVNCGKQVTGDIKFCPSCGQEVHRDEVQVETYGRAIEKTKNRYLKFWILSIVGLVFLLLGMMFIFACHWGGVGIIFMYAGFFLGIGFSITAIVYGRKMSRLKKE